MANSKLIQYLLFLCGRRLRFVVEGDSMRPLLKHGMIVFGKKKKDVHVRDVVVAEHPFRKKYIIKEISSVSDDKVELVSKDSFAEDSRTFGSIRASSIIATIVWIPKS